MSSNSKDAHLLWDLVESHEDRRFNLFSIRINRSRSPRNGRTYEFQVLTSPDWVCVVPVTAENLVVMVRQFRHGTQELSLEPPGGLCKVGVTPEQSAREELEEETGYHGGDWKLLSRMDAIPALFTNKFYVFAATNVVPTGKAHPDETEEVETVLVPADELRQYIERGKITSSMMVAALLLFLEQWEQTQGRAV